MKLRAPRFTVRRLMVAVAIVAVAFGAEAWRRRYLYCLGRAARSVSIERSHLWMAGSHARIAALYRERAAIVGESYRYHDEQAMIFSRAARVEKAKARRAADRGQAYRRAAVYPWLSIAPEEADSAGFRPPDLSERDGESTPRR